MSSSQGEQQEDGEMLYDDLSTTVLPPASKKPRRDGGGGMSLENRVKELEAQVEQCRKENEVLKRNMGTLYRTARAEIRRKDTEITSLQQQLEEKANNTR